MNELLNPSQKASLTIVLRMFEENLRQADGWLDGRLIEGILYHREVHLPLLRRTRARERIASALAEIGILSQEINLEAEVQDPADLIRGQMSIAWANLVDSLADKLKRYGEVHPSVAMKIDPHIQRLAQAALELATLFENHSSSRVKT